MRPLGVANFLLVTQTSGIHCLKTRVLQLETVTEDIFTLALSVCFGALEVCHENALYKFTSDI